MLAALLCNLPVPRGRPKPEYTPDLDSKFIWCDDEYINIELKKPSKAIVKKVLKAVQNIKLEKAAVDGIIRTLTNFSEAANSLVMAQQLKAFADAVSLLQKSMMQNEEDELIALLMLT